MSSVQRQITERSIEFTGYTACITIFSRQFNQKTLIAQQKEKRTKVKMNYDTAGLRLVVSIFQWLILERRYKATIEVRSSH